MSITTYPHPLLKDEPGTVRVEVKNEGSAATTTNCWVGLYIGRPPVGDPDEKLFISPLAVNQSDIVSYTITLTELGACALTTWVDWLDWLSEEDEANNQYSDYVWVEKPTPTPNPTSTPLPTSTPTPTSTPSTTPTPRPGEPVNLVYNGDFEGEFIHHEGVGEVADGWTPFVETESSPQFMRGERAKDQSSQRIWSDYVPFRVGISQRIVGCTPGQVYIARAEMLSIFGEGNTPVQGMNMGKQIGLDPRGGDDPSSPHVIWSDLNWKDRAWQKVEVSATAEAGVVTLFIRVDNVYGGHNDLFYMDEVTLYSFEPTPTPTQSPAPTATPTATSTSSPSPTVTSLPLQPSTPSATPFPLTTATSTSTPTPAPEAEGQLSPTLTPTTPSSPSAIRRLIPLFFALGLVIIVLLIGAIIWLQPQ